MVRAILAGSKTQTCRLLNTDHRMSSTGEILRYEFGRPGDRLWVRETHALIWPGEFPPEDMRLCSVEYRADTGAKYPGEWPADAGSNPDCPKWSPSIHMPRWASRLTLEITDVRVERLQDISEADARAEGVQPLQMDNGSYLPSFEGLWDTLNAKRAPWSSNPWVWVISFKVVPNATSQT